MAIIPDDNDVISFTDVKLSPVKATTVTHAELTSAIGSLIKSMNPNLEPLLYDGAECRYLSEQGGGWKKGKIQLKFEVTLEEDPSN